MKKIVLLAGMFLWLTSQQQVWSQTRTKLNVVYPAVTGVMMGLWVAAETQVFQKYGLDVSLLYVPSAPRVVRVMLAGESQITVTGGAAVVSANLSGADFVFIGGIVNVPAFYVMAMPEIKSIEDLKGAPSVSPVSDLLRILRCAMCCRSTACGRKKTWPAPTRRHDGVGNRAI